MLQLCLSFTVVSQSCNALCGVGGGKDFHSVGRETGFPRLRKLYNARWLVWVIIVTQAQVVLTAELALLPSSPTQCREATGWGIVEATYAGVWNPFRADLRSPQNVLCRLPWPGGNSHCSVFALKNQTIFKWPLVPPPLHFPHPQIVSR